MQLYDKITWPQYYINNANIYFLNKKLKWKLYIIKKTFLNIK